MQQIEPQPKEKTECQLIDTSFPAEEHKKPEPKQPERVTQKAAETFNTNRTYLSGCDNKLTEPKQPVACDNKLTQPTKAIEPQKQPERVTQKAAEVFNTNRPVN